MTKLWSRWKGCIEVFSATLNLRTCQEFTLDPSKISENLHLVCRSLDLPASSWVLIHANPSDGTCVLASALALRTNRCVLREFSCAIR